jgi:hypothetical protein
VNLDNIRRLVALPDAVIRNSVPVAGATGVPIQQAFIGCCANGTLGDLAEAARVVKGRKIGSLTGGPVPRHPGNAGGVQRRAQMGVRCELDGGRCGGHAGHLRRVFRRPCSSPARPASPPAPIISKVAWAIPAPASTWPRPSHPAARWGAQSRHCGTPRRVDQQTLLPQRCEFWAPRPRIPGATRPFRKGKPPRCRSRTLRCATAKTSALLKARRVSSILLDLMTHGLYSHLEREGLIEPSATGG